MQVLIAYLHLKLIQAGKGPNGQLSRRGVVHKARREKVWREKVLVPIF